MGKNFVPSDGDYYYRPHRNMWGIWQHHELQDGFGNDTFIKDCASKQEVIDEVARLNGWTTGINNQNK